MNRENLVRVLTASVAVLFAALFVSGYDGIRYHNFHHEPQSMLLPVLVCLVHSTAKYFWLIAPAVFILGIALIKKNLAVTIIVSTAWLIAFGWVLFCIFIWETPLILL